MLDFWPPEVRVPCLGHVPLLMCTRYTTPTVDGLHSPRFVSEEPEAFGSLKRAMRGLRPWAEERLSVQRVTEELRIHIYRRAQGENGDGETMRLGFSIDIRCTVWLQIWGLIGSRSWLWVKILYTHSWSGKVWGCSMKRGNLTQFLMETREW